MFQQQVSPHVMLRGVRIEDATKVYPLIDLNRKMLSQWLGWVELTNSADDLRRFYQQLVVTNAKRQSLMCLIYYQNQVVGSCGFNTVNAVNHSATIGYWLADAFQGRGIMTDCVSTLLQVGFERLNLNKIVILAADSNIKSINIAKRIGFKRDGVLRQHAMIQNEFHDFMLYSILESEWALQHTHQLSSI